MSTHFNEEGRPRPGFWPIPDDNEVNVSAIRADERERCRAELLSELNVRAMLDMTDKYEDLIRWAREEAFGGE